MDTIMLNISFSTAAATEIVERAAAAIVNVTGTTATERKLSVIADMGSAALLACAAFGGKTGKVAMQGLVTHSAMGLAQPAAWPLCDYKPLAQLLASQLGEAIVIGSRATFLAQGDLFDGRIMTYTQKRAGKGEGYKTDKFGNEVPDATLGKLLALRQLIGDVTDIADAISAENKRVAEERKTLKALEAMKVAA